MARTDSSPGNTHAAHSEHGQLVLDQSKPQAGSADPRPDQDARTPQVRVQTLGRFRVWRAGELIPASAWQRRKAGTLFKAQLAAPGLRLRREQAIALLWPEIDSAPERDGDETGRLYLRVGLHRLRQLLDHAGTPPNASIVRDEAGVLALAVHSTSHPQAPTLPPEAWLDAAAFRQASAHAQQSTYAAAYLAALDLYTGDFLPDDELLDAEWETRWIERQRDELRALALALRLRLADLYAAAGQYDLAHDQLRALLQRAPAHEDAAARLMGLLSEQGRRAEALQVYQSVAAALQHDLDLSPSAELERLRVRLVTQEHAPVAAQLPPRDPPAPRPTNLPAPLSSFVGRAWEQEEVRRLLRATRLLTLTGAGGCGKTRLAQAAADGVVAEYADGVWLVELAACSDPAQLPQLIARALGLREESGHSLPETLCTFLAPRRLLLLLDNCEHLIAECAALAETLLRACPRLTILATSREVLGLSGETVWVTPTLAVPPTTAQTPAQVARYEAAHLFVERARAVQAGFALDARTSRAVAAVCRHLDGIPLALELAAACLAHQDVEQVASGLDHRFQLLTQGSRTALPRQRTLRGTLDWSYDLLTPSEQLLLRRLTAFAGGWMQDAATAVCAASPIDRDDVPDLLGALARKSLALLEHADGATRYDVLETVRAYARERATASEAMASDMEAARERHLDWCLCLAEDAEPRLVGPEQATYLDLLEREHDNLRAALAWARESGRLEAALRLAAALWRFWYMRGYFGAGRTALEELLALAPRAGVAIAAPVLAAACGGAGNLAYAQGDYLPAIAWHEQGLALWRQVEDTANVARTLGNLGAVAWKQSNLPQATALYEESLELARAAGDKRTMANALNSLGTFRRDRRDYAEAVALWREALALRRELGDTKSILESRNNLALVALAQDDLDEARRQYQALVDLTQGTGDALLRATVLNNLGEVEQKQGHHPRARYTPRALPCCGRCEIWAAWPPC